MKNDQYSVRSGKRKKNTAEKYNIYLISMNACTILTKAKRFGKRQRIKDTGNYCQTIDHAFSTCFVKMGFFNIHVRRKGFFILFKKRICKYSFHCNVLDLAYNSVYICHLGKTLLLNKFQREYKYNMRDFQVF